MRVVCARLTNLTFHVESMLEEWEHLLLHISWHSLTQRWNFNLQTGCSKSSTPATACWCSAPPKEVMTGEDETLKSAMQSQVEAFLAARNLPQEHLLLQVSWHSLHTTSSQGRTWLTRRTWLPLARVFEDRSFHGGPIFLSLFVQGRKRPERLPVNLALTFGSGTLVMAHIIFQFLDWLKGCL